MICQIASRLQESVLLALGSGESEGKKNSRRKLFVIRDNFPPFDFGGQAPCSVGQFRFWMLPLESALQKLSRLSLVDSREKVGAAATGVEPVTSSLLFGEQLPRLC